MVMLFVLSVFSQHTVHEEQATTKNGNKAKHTSMESRSIITYCKHLIHSHETKQQ